MVTPEFKRRQHPAAPALSPAPVARAPALRPPAAGGGVALAAPPRPALRPGAQAQAPAPAPAPNWQVNAGPGQNVILMPGQMSFSTASAQLRTLLGSCVSITIWHPVRRIGGMCHFLLPQRQRRQGEALDGRYGDEAMEVMVDKLSRAGTRPSEYVAHLYGGADTMPEGNGLKFNVGERNIERGWTLIDQYGFQLEGVDVGEDVPRTVSIHLGTGEVDMRRGVGKAPVNPGVAARANGR